MVSQLTQSPLQIANPEKLERIRHTCAHVMAMAVQILFPETKVTIGPTTDTGFYYDFDVVRGVAGACIQQSSDRPQPFTPEDLKKITKQMRFIIKANLPIIREEVTREEIKAEIEQLNESYKLEILDSIPEGETITRYYIGSPDGGRLPDVGKKLQAALPEPSLIKPVKIPATVSWWDLCAGPHINYTGEINNLKQEHNWTILEVSHDLDLVSKYCDSVICMNRHLLYQGSPSTTLTPENRTYTVL
jgi:threonyl-tRNA synthetase